jgi:holo-[acyl-carrier protein] synthase
VIVGLGIDLVEVDRIEKAIHRWGAPFLARIMDPAEVAALPPGWPPVGAVADAVAVKEAVSKAIGTGWSGGVRWRDVVVEHGSTPAARLYGAALAVARRLGSSGATEVRIEHPPGLVIATVRLLA